MEPERYASYNGLGRTALMFGVPLLPFLGISFLIILTAVVGMLAFGLLAGMIIPALLMCILIGLRIACENDDRAPERLWWRFKGLCLRMLNTNKGFSILSLVSGSHQSREKNVRRFFKESREYRH